MPEGDLQPEQSGSGHKEAVQSCQGGQDQDALLKQGKQGASGVHGGQDVLSGFQKHHPRAARTVVKLRLFREQEVAQRAVNVVVRFTRVIGQVRSGTGRV